MFLIILGNCALQAQSRIWGTTVNGFETGFGGVFSIGTEGEDFQVQHAFGENPGHSPNFAELLTASDGKFYGTTTNGGFDDNGVLFQFDTAGNKYKALVIFNKINGGQPYGGVIQAFNGKLYGMTNKGGTHDRGVIYSYDIDSLKLRVIHHFKDTATGNRPYGDLLEIRDGILYGMTYTGGIYNRGVIFSYDVMKDTVTKHFDFNDTLGSRPRGSLTLVGGRLYGVTTEGGVNTGRGAVFSMDTATNVVTRHYSFGSSTGEYPMGRLIMANNGKLYGVASAGGLTPGNMAGYSGAVFAIDTSNNSFSVIRQFSGVASLANPIGSLVKLNNGKLYGVCSYHINSPNKGGIYSIRPNSTYTVERDFGTNDQMSLVSSPLTALANGKLIGMANRGGEHINRGTIYMFDTATKVPTKLLEFGTSLSGNIANGSLTRAENGKIYGTTREGGTQRRGVLFSIDPFTSEQKVLHNFVISSSGPYFPDTKLTEGSNGKLYGVTGRGGNGDNGTIFSYDTSTNTLTRLHSFSNTSNGANPKGNVLIDSSGILYGTTNGGGNNNRGVLYRFDPSNNSYSKLADFVDSVGGQNPNGQLTWAKDGSILGTCVSGGINGGGTIFRFNPKDSTLITAVSLVDSLSGTNPTGGLMHAANGLYYGMAEYHGNHGNGTIYSFNDSSFKTKIEFHFKDTATGIFPQGNLIQASNGWLYGMTNRGGSENLGAAFRFDIDSGKFERIYSFSGTDGAYPAFNEMLELFTTPNSWIGSMDTLWTNYENWSHKEVPTGIVEAVIPSSAPRYPLIDISIKVNKLTIDSGAEVSIGRNASLTVLRTLKNDGIVHVLDDGHLLPGANYTQSGTGLYRVHRQNPNDDTTSFSLWSSPVMNGSSDTLPGSALSKLRFIPGGSSFADFDTLAAHDTLIACIGYAAGADSLTDIVFSGLAFNGDLYTTVAHDTDFQVINLLGNPYPSAINLGQLISNNDQVLDRSVYIKMPPSNSSKYSADGLVSINDNGASGSGFSDTNITLNTTEIGVARGFFVLALKNDTVRFDNSLRNSNEATLNSVNDPLKIWLTITAADSFYSQTLCAFSPFGTVDYDIGQDAIRFQPQNGLAIYSLLNGKKMSIQGMPTVDTSMLLPIGLRSKAAGTYTIRMTDAKQDAYYKILLEDLDSNKLYDLKSESVKFTLAQNQDVNARFRLRIEKILPSIKIVKNKLCQGDTAVFEVVEPASGFRYQWIVDGNAGQADTLITYKATKAGKLALRQYDLDNNSEQTADLNIVIYPLPTRPALQQNITLIGAGSGYAAYKWFRNGLEIKDSTRASLLVIQNGMYHSIVGDTNQCQSFSDTLDFAPVTIDVVSNNLCIGDTAISEVENPESGFKYQWIVDGTSTQADTALSIGLYKSADLRLVKWHSSGYRDTSVIEKIVFKSLPTKPKLSAVPGSLDAGSGYTKYEWYRDGIKLNGITVQSIFYRTKGNFHCVVENSDGCINYSDTVIIKKTEILTVVNDPCNGDTAKFEIKETKSGFRYKWYLSGLSSLQDSNKVYRTTIAGNLIVIESNQFGYRDTSAIEVITIRPLPAIPSISITEGRFDAGAGYNNHQWFLAGAGINNANGQYYNIRDTGIYSCYVENVEGCISYSAPFRVIGPSINEVKNNVCDGDSAIFEVTATKPGFHYQWISSGNSNLADTNLVKIAKTSTDLILVEWNQYGYRDTTASIAAVINPLPAVPIITLDITSLNAGAGYDTYQWLWNNTIIKGDTAQRLDLTKGGNYTCQVSNGFGCLALSNNFIVQAASIVATTNNVCEGDSNVFEILNPKAGFSYQWMLDGMPVSQANGTYFSSAVAGIVSAEERNNFGYSEISNVISSVVNPFPNAPVLTYQNGRLDAGPGFDGYQWLKDILPIGGEKSQTYVPTGPGTYQVRVSSKGCATPSNSIALDKADIQTLVLNNRCKSDPLAFNTYAVNNSDTGNFNYQWLLDESPLPNGTLTIIAIATSGNLKLVKWNATGFYDTSKVVVVELYPTPEPVLAQRNDTLDAGGPYASYQWYKNQQALQNETNQTLLITGNGDYYCRVTSDRACIGNSNILKITGTNITNIDNSIGIELYPNPTLNETYVSVQKADLAFASLYDLRGILIREIGAVSATPVKIDLSELPAGTYLLQVESDGIKYFKRIVKQ